MWDCCRAEGSRVGRAVVGGVHLRPCGCAHRPGCSGAGRNVFRCHARALPAFLSSRPRTHLRCRLSHRFKDVLCKSDPMHPQATSVHLRSHGVSPHCAVAQDFKVPGQRFRPRNRIHQARSGHASVRRPDRTKNCMTISTRWLLQLDSQLIARLLPSEVAMAARVVTGMLQRFPHHLDALAPPLLLLVGHSPKAQVRDSATACSVSLTQAAKFGLYKEVIASGVTSQAYMGSWGCHAPFFDWLSSSWNDGVVQSGRHDHQRCCVKRDGFDAMLNLDHSWMTVARAGCCKGGLAQCCARTEFGFTSID